MIDPGSVLTYLVYAMQPIMTFVSFLMVTFCVVWYKGVGGWKSDLRVKVMILANLLLWLHVAKFYIDWNVYAPAPLVSYAISSPGVALLINVLTLTAAAIVLQSTIFVILRKEKWGSSLLLILSTIIATLVLQSEYHYLLLL